MVFGLTKHGAMLPEHDPGCQPAIVVARLWSRLLRALGGAAAGSGPGERRGGPRSGPSNPAHGRSPASARSARKIATKVLHRAPANIQSRLDTTPGGGIMPAVEGGRLVPARHARDRSRHEPRGLGAGLHQHHPYQRPLLQRPGCQQPPDPLLPGVPVPVNRFKQLLEAVPVWGASPSGVRWQTEQWAKPPGPAKSSSPWYLPTQRSRNRC